MEFSPDDLAKQMTILDNELFQKVDVSPETCSAHDVYTYIHVPLLPQSRERVPTNICPLTPTPTNFASQCIA